MRMRCFDPKLFVAIGAFLFASVVLACEDRDDPSPQALIITPTEAVVPTPTVTPTPAPTETPTPIPTDTPIPAPTRTPTPTSTDTPVPLPTDTPTPLPTDTPVPPPTDTPTPLPTDTPVPVPTDTPTPLPTDTPVPPPSDTPTPAPTDTPIPPTETPTPVPTATPIPPPTETPTPTATPTPSPDRPALIALYEATDGPNWTNNRDWLSDRPIGEWYGVTTTDGRVKELVLPENRLQGEIPPEIGSLSEMTLLVLWNNVLNGEIPQEVGGMSSLREVYLGNNQLTGELPRDIGLLTNLEVLSVSDNNLTGSIPVEIGELQNLRELSLSFNEIGGELPKEIGNLTNLTLIDLWSNQLSGPLPVEIGNLVKLQTLDIGGNDFGGRLPSEFILLEDLEVFYGFDNSFSGELPAGLSNLDNLRILSLWGNNLTGEIPAELGQLRNLEELSIFSNRFEGMIPSELADIPNLRELSVGGNNLSGCVTDQLKDVQENDLDLIGIASCGERDSLVAIFNATAGEGWSDRANWLSDQPVSDWYGVIVDANDRIVGLDLGGNNLVGELPTEIGDMVHLERISLYDNEITGSIPSELAVLENLQRLFVGGNNLSGCIPDGLPQAPNSDVGALGLERCVDMDVSDDTDRFVASVYSNAPDAMNLTWWHEFDDVAQQGVYRDGKLVAELDRAVRFYSVDGLDPNQRYAFEVRVELRDGMSESIVAEVATLAHRPQIAPYANVNVDGFSIPIIDELNPEGTEYLVKIRRPGTDFEESADWGPSQCVSFDGLEMGKLYFPVVNARNLDGVESFPAVYLFYDQAGNARANLDTQPGVGQEDQWAIDRINETANIYALPEASRSWLLDDIPVVRLTDLPSTGYITDRIYIGAPLGTHTFMHEYLHGFWQHWEHFPEPCDVMNNYTFRRDVADFMVEFREADQSGQPNPWEQWRPLYNFWFGMTEGYRSDDGVDIWGMFEQRRYGELYDTLYHTLEADMSAYVRNKTSLIPPRLQPYFSEFYGNAEVSTWDEELRWYAGLSETDKRLWDNFFGHHAVLSTSPEYANVESVDPTKIEAELYEELVKSDRRQLVDFINTLEDVACDTNCEEFWKSKYAYFIVDLEAHLYRYSIYFDQIGPETGIEVDEDNLASVGEALELLVSDIECGSKSANEVVTAIDAIDGLTDAQRQTFRQIIDQLLDPDEFRLYTHLLCPSV